MAVKHRVPLALAALLLGSSLAPACGGDSEEGANEMPVVNIGGGGRGGGASQTASASRARAAAAAATEAPAMSESVVEEVSFDESTRDPFEREFPEGESELLLSEAMQLEPVQAVDLGPLASYPLESLRLQAIITRTPEPRAMFLVPDGSGLAVLARVDDRVGPNGTGRIVDIQPNRVVVTYEGPFEFGDTGEQVRTHVVTLRDPARDIDAEFEPY